MKKKLSNYSEMLKRRYDSELPSLSSNKLYSGIDPFTAYAIVSGAIGILWQAIDIYIRDLDEKAAEDAGWYGGSQDNVTPRQTTLDKYEVKPEPEKTDALPGKLKKAGKGKYT